MNELRSLPTMRLTSVRVGMAERMSLLFGGQMMAMVGMIGVEEEVEEEVEAEDI